MKIQNNRFNWGRAIFLLVALIAIFSLLLSACAPAQGLQGAGGQGNSNGNGNGNGGGNGNSNGGGNGNGGGGGNSGGGGNGGGGGNSGGGGNGGGGGNSGGGSGNTNGTGNPNVQNPNGVNVQGSKQDPSDPCLDQGQLPCGQGDHGKGNPVNGSLHANCRAAQGEVDPVCTPKDIVLDISAPPGSPPVVLPPVLPTPPINEVQPAPAISASCPNWIMFHTFRTGDLEIFRIDGFEGSKGVQPIDLSNSSSNDSRPSRSPNDQSVVFQSNRNGNIELYLTDSEGKSQSRLTHTNSNNINAMFGPDNQSIVYQSDRNGSWDIFLINKDSGKEIQLTSDPHDDINPFWSPDKNWITFQSNRTGSWNVFLLNLSSGAEYQVTSFTQGVLFPSWSPNGKQLAYFINTSGTLDLYVSDLKGQSFKQISIGSDAGNASWSPDGNKLAYQLTTGDNTDIYTYDLSSNTEYQLTDFSGVDSAPTWNCGGTDISFTSNRNGNPDIFSTWWQGGSDTYEITNSPSTDKWSEWSPSKEPGSRGY